MERLPSDLVQEVALLLDFLSLARLSVTCHRVRNAIYCRYFQDRVIRAKETPAIAYYIKYIQCEHKVDPIRVLKFLDTKLQLLNNLISTTIARLYDFDRLDKTKYAEYTINLYSDEPSSNFVEDYPIRPEKV